MARSRKNRNPNQQALPGMEHLSHPGAQVLANNPDGHFFHYGPDQYSHDARIGFALDDGPNHEYDPKYPNEGRPRNSVTVAHMDWNAGPKREPGPVHQGEIGDVYTHPAYRRQGMASALWNVSRQMLPYTKPTHSPERTRAGDAWARAVGGRRPPLDPVTYNPLMD